MAKAKLVTRSATTSTVTDDNLNKASALTHAEMDSNLINLRDSSFGIADDTSTVLQVTHDKTITVAGSGTVGTALSGDTLTITGSGITATSTDTLQNKTIDTANNTITITESDISDLGSYITASSTDTLTNKTFDANGTGNSISNIETADIAAATLVTAADTIASNNNDTTIPTSAAVKAYADSVGGGGGGTITALNNQAENRLVSIGSTTTELDGEANLTFDGSTLSLTGSAALDGVTITDNSISTNRSNDNLNIQANGTGIVDIGAPLEETSLYSSYFGNTSRIKGSALVYEDLALNPNDLTDREYGHAIHMGTRLTASSTNSNFRPRAAVIGSTVDLDGFSYTDTNKSRGPLGAMVLGVVENSSATDATINVVRALETSGVVTDYNNLASNISVVDLIGNYSTNYLDRDGTGDISVTNSINYWAESNGYHDGSGSLSITNAYGYYYAGHSGAGTATNKYAFYDASNSLSVFGDIQTQGVSITDNLITTNRSNDNLDIEANGTGRVNIGSPVEESTLYPAYMGAASRIKGASITYEDLAVNPNDLTDREYGASIFQGSRITASSTNSNFRPRALVVGSTVDLDGFNYTNTSNFRGPLGAMIIGSVVNTSATNSTINTVRGVESSAAITDYTGSAGDITIVDAIGNYCANFIERDGSGDATITNAYNFFATGDSFNSGTGTNSLTNQYGFYFEGIQNITPTNNYAFYDAANALSRFGAVILANQAGDPSGVTDSAHIYAKDDAGSSEVYVRDEAGNVTKISPHNEAGEWEYYSRNSKTGKTVRINMEKLVAEVEKLSGKSFIESE